jgi:hypothetical protein
MGSNCNCQSTEDKTSEMKDYHCICCIKRYIVKENAKIDEAKLIIEYCSTKKGNEGNSCCNVCQTDIRKCPELESNCKCTLECYIVKKEVNIKEAEIILEHWSKTAYSEVNEQMHSCKTCHFELKTIPETKQHCPCSLERHITKREAGIKQAKIMLEYWIKHKAITGHDYSYYCDICKTVESKPLNDEIFCKCSLEKYVIDMTSNVSQDRNILSYWVKITPTEGIENADVCAICKTSHSEELNGVTHCKCSLERFLFQSEADNERTGMNIRYWTRTSGAKTEEDSDKMLRDMKLLRSKTDYNIAQAKVLLEFKSKVPSTKLDFLGIQTDSAIKTDIDHYPMKSKQVGFHLIFAQTFKNHHWLERSGTELDIEALRNAFSYLGFENVVFRDQSKNDLLDTLALYSKRKDHTDKNCLAVTILTHGQHGILYTKDGEISAEELWTPFEADRCPSLAEKPKIIITQACRGSGITKTVKVAHPDSGITTYCT